jgi:MoaA/NifB/PqqE/SkfB family radical SAM enzyme
MCDIWKANARGLELTVQDLEPHIDGLRRLHVERIVLSGGEALMHSNLWALCEALKRTGARVTLLSTGLLLERHATATVRWCDDVIVSLDGSQPIHDAIRGVPRAFERVAAGVAALKAEAPAFRVIGRCVVQRANFRDVPGVIAAAHAIGLDGISFLAADVSSTAFNRPEGWDPDRAGEIALSREEADEFEEIVEAAIERSGDDFRSGFIAESPEKLRTLPDHFRALHGAVEFPRNRCNAPWVSAVVEADGVVRPCFFHRPIGNIATGTIEGVVNSDEAVSFRRSLDVSTDPICRKCVCTLHLGLRARP